MLDFAVGVIKNVFLGREPGLVVIGEDSCSKCCGFESRCHIHDGHLDILSH